MPSANRPNRDRIRDTSPTEPANDMPTPWREGDRVFAPWEATWARAGTIQQIKTDEAQRDQAHIAFDLGGSGWVLVASLGPLTVRPGQKARIRRYFESETLPRGTTAYVQHTVEILEVSGEEVRVGFENGADEWTTLAALEIPCVENGPGAQPPPLSFPVKIDLDEEQVARGIRAIHAASLPPAPEEGAPAGVRVPWPVIITAIVVTLLLLWRIGWRLMSD